MINVIIPIGGIGERFKSENYQKPKPLVNVLGKPIIFWVLDNLKTIKDDKIYIPYHNSLKKYSFEELLIDRYPDKNFIFKVIDRNTNGACDTINHILIENILDTSLPTISIDCDTFYYDDIIKKFRDTANNCIFYHINSNDKPIFSYIKIKNNLVSEIQEKIKISDLANVGAYGFRDGYTLSKYVKKILDNKTNGEQYISNIYKTMVNDGEPIVPLKVDNFNCLGTPNQIKLFSSNNINKIDGQNRFCFDLDNTLVTNPKIKGDYTTVEPIESTINFLKFLKRNGCYIIIYTARRMRTHSNNLGLVVKDIGKITLDTLDKFNIEYDEIHFGKPYAHFYIDDLAINTNSDIEKESGFYNIHVPSRTFNKIEFQENHVIKTTNNECEIFWYNNAPSTVKNLLPKFEILNSNVIKMEKVEGVSLTHLYNKNDLNRTTLVDLLKTIELIHKSKPSINEVDNLTFYTFKLDERLKKYDYYKFKDFDLVIDKLNTFLNDYVKSNKPMFVIHGDPVFTNIFTTLYGFKFIDMRGSFNIDNCSIYGDIFYDYAKIYQSILGYDTIIMGEKLNDTYINYLESVFIDELSKKFTSKDILDIRTITGYLYLTLIPLHEDNFDRLNKFYNIAKKLIL